MCINDLGVRIEDVDLLGLPLGIVLFITYRLSHGSESRVYDSSKHNKRIDLSDKNELESIINSPVKKVKHEYIAYQLYI